jgi:hypothetical protein
LAEVNNYAYNLSKEGVYVNLYGSNQLKTKTLEGRVIEVEQQANYPWDGKVVLKIIKAPKGEYSFFLRIPGWSSGTTIMVNDQQVQEKIVSGTYTRIKRKWKKGDTIELDIPMPVELMQANPLVEETKNQVAVKRGPIVYCLESEDISQEADVNSVSLDIDSKFKTQFFELKGRGIVTIKAKVFLDNQNWSKKLYRPLRKEKSSVDVTLIPYYTWGNRSKGDMSVWLSF